MKIKWFLLAFIVGGMAAGIPCAHAFYYSPYPPVLSQALDVLPPGFVTLNAGDEVFYYYGGVFYQKIMRDQKYITVPPPIGIEVFSIPAGYQYLVIGGWYYYVSGGVYYQRTLNGFRVVSPPM